MITRVTPWELAEQLDDEANRLYELLGRLPVGYRKACAVQIDDAAKKLQAVAAAVRAESRRALYWDELPL